MTHSRKFELPEVSHRKIVQHYVEEIPDEDYQHASDEAIEAFLDLKFGIRIHFGLYSHWHLRGESWRFLLMSRKKRQKYQEIYKEFNPSGFDAEQWVQFFKRSGLKIFAITTKHHEGFSLFDTKTRVKRRINWTDGIKPRIEECDLAYSVMETPFKRDIIGELCDAAHSNDMKIDLYFSHPDWYDADFRPYAHHPINTPDSKKYPRKYNGTGSIFNKSIYVLPDRTDEETRRMIVRHRQQLVELLSNYGKIDLICLDQWLGPDVWPELKATMKMIRKIQPDVMFRARGIGNYGDYHTPEGYVPGSPENTDMPWMVIYPLGRSFSFEKRKRKHKGTRWLIHNLIDTAAKGGGVFMAGIGPDRFGKFHPEAIKQLEDAGKWLETNGEGMYSTRPWTEWKEGKNMRYTRNKEATVIYLHLFKWPGREVKSRLVKPKRDSDIRMLGVESPLEWKLEKSGLKITLPGKKPCDFAWTIKIQQPLIT